MLINRLHSDRWWFMQPNVSSELCSVVCLRASAVLRYGSDPAGCSWTKTRESYSVLDSSSSTPDTEHTNCCRLGQHYNSPFTPVSRHLWWLWRMDANWRCKNRSELFRHAVLYICSIRQSINSLVLKYLQAYCHEWTTTVRQSHPLLDILQPVLNAAAARLVFSTIIIIRLLCDLHWLTVELHIIMITIIASWPWSSSPLMPLVVTLHYFVMFVNIAVMLASESRVVLWWGQSPCCRRKEQLVRVSTDVVKYYLASSGRCHLQCHE